MKKRISKRVREEAALICAITASSMPQPVGGMEAQEAIGASNDAYWLAYEAWSFAWEQEGFHRAVVEGRAEAVESDAEAEALLRTGWSPS